MERRTADADPLAAEPEARMRAVAAGLAQAVAEHTPAGWVALLLAPPPGDGPLTWHVHLAPTVRLDLADGRAIGAAPPAGGHEWLLPSGRRASVARGDPTPAPGASTVAVRVAGPHFSATLDGATLVLRCPDRKRRTHELAVPAVDAERVSGAARQAVELAVEARLAGATPMLAYSPRSWSAHARTWLRVAGR
jgi:hypothetical protein